LLLNSLKNDTFNNIYFKKLNCKMADFSYSLYLFHFPFFVFLLSVFYVQGVKLILLQPTIMYLFYYLGFMILIYAYAWILFYLFEKNTYNIQKHLVNNQGD